STKLLLPWLIRSMDYFRTLLVGGQPNGLITASPEGDGDPSIVLKELTAFKQMMNVIERFIKSRNDNLSEDSVAKQSVEKEIKSSDEKADSAISNVLIGEISCQNLVQEQIQSRNMTESLILDVFHGELSIVETSKNEALSEEFDPKEYDKNASESEIINVLTGQVSCDKYVGGFYECEYLKLYYTDSKEYPSSSMTQLLQAAVLEQISSQILACTLVDLNLPNLNESFTESQVNEYVEFDFDNPENYSLSDMVKIGEEEIHSDGLETVDDPFVQTPNKQNSKEMSMYVNEINVVNENQPPSSEIGQLIRKRFVGKALVEPYIVQPPTSAPSTFLKVDKKRLKRKARLLQIQNTRISFDDDVGDDNPILKFSLWKNRRAQS
nr:hypothetical protein [Tanacetum cinerariifolium]